MTQRLTRILALTAVLMISLCICLSATGDGAAVNVPGLSIQFDQLQSFEEQTVPLSAGSSQFQLPPILLWSLPVAGVTVLVICLTIILRDRKQIRQLTQRLSQVRR